ncbi:UNVERIFIED_CONTAM: hypothetical protein GTU68_009384 [Idotea baltica]|nr:hypothetical protein [Idotea baltica]
MQFMRYKNARLFAFDKGNSLYAASLCGGQHFDIASSISPSFAPLSTLDEDFEWCENYLEKLLILQGVETTPQIRLKIAEALERMRGLENQTMSEFVTLVQDTKISEALTYYTVGNRCGDLLDAQVDTMELSNLQVFEIESLMNRGDKDLIPVLMYLFRKIERSLKGQPSAIIIDEAWMALGHPVFREMIREWLKVLRKANCVVILATQSLSDAINSGMLDVLSESCPTKIYLPNPSANQEVPKAAYKQLGLNEQQIYLIENAVQKRQYYMSTTEGSRLFDLALNDVQLAFVGVSDKTEVSALKEIYKNNKDSWYLEWIASRLNN